MGEQLECDVAVIGAGTAGLSAERSARRVGARTLLIDPAFSGTTCANVGCMPSKLLIAAADAAHSAAMAGNFGVETTVRIDGPAVMARLRRERDHFAKATRDEIGELPDGVAVRARARFIGPTALGLDDGREVSAKAVVIATGARPSVPDAFDPIAGLVLTNENVFELEDLPGALAVVGAGPLGLELAQAMARLGVKVTVRDQSAKIAGLADEEMARRIKDVLSREMTIVLGVDVDATMDGRRAGLNWTGEATGDGLFDRVLVAAGRPPALDDLDLDRAGLRLDARGVPVFDRETMRCGSSAVFLAGDADADRPVLHEASAEGALAGANAAAYPEVRPGRRGVPFSIMFTDPPLALVGRRSGDGLITGQADYRDQGRARVEARAHGIARLHANAGDGRLTGATLFCPGADHLGHLLAWSVESGATAQELLDRPFYHPTFEEGLKPALRSICAQVGLQLPDARDEGGPSGS